MSQQLRVGMVGYAFMGAAHSQAWRTVNHAFDLPLSARMSMVCGRSADAVAGAAAKLGWEGHTTDWRSLIESDEIDLIDICTPGDTHAEIALAALAAGKHVLCEKPLANSVAEAREMAAAATEAQTRGVRTMCGFNYRRVPAVALMRQLVAAGRIGEIRHVRAVYLQDWIVDPQFPLVWRLQAERAGSGRSRMNVSVRADTPVSRSPRTNWAMSTMCAPMSPSAPEPAFSACSRQTSGNSGSTIQSCRYSARTWRTVPTRPSCTKARARARAGTRR